MTDKGRVLVVEDNPQNLKLARIILEDEGYSVIAAADAEEAFAALALESPDILVLDVGLPAMDGLTLARLLRADSRTARLPLVAVSAFAMKGDRERALGAGFDAYVTKPLERRLLLSAIETLLRGRQLA